MDGPRASRRTVLKGAAAASAAIATGLGTTAQAAARARAGWTSQTLAFAGNADTYSGTRTWVDIAPSGRSVILYHKGPHNLAFNLWLARGPYPDGSFRHQRIDREDKQITGLGTLAVGPLGRAHVAYISGIYYDQGILKYAVSSPAGWTVETPDPVLASGATAIALDSHNHPVIAYSKVPNGLWLARRGPAGWTTTPIIPDERIWFHDIALDADDNPRIAYIVTPEQINVWDFELRLATYDGAAWNIETVSYISHDGIEFGVELLIDDDGFEDMVFPVWSPEPAIAHARRTASGWQHGIVDTGNLWNPSLARNAAGDLHVTYYNANRGSLKYAPYVGGAWHPQTVADNRSPSIRIGRESSIAIDDAGIARVTYYVGNEFSGTTLRYATSDEPVPFKGRDASDGRTAGPATWSTAATRSSGRTGGS